MLLKKRGKTYKEIFENNPEEALVNAVKAGMNVYLRKYSNRFDDETFFEAAVRNGTPVLVNACIDMGAYVNCAAPQGRPKWSYRCTKGSGAPPGKARRYSECLMGFGSVYEEELHIKIEKGIVTNTRIMDNRDKEYDDYLMWTIFTCWVSI